MKTAIAAAAVLLLFLAMPAFAHRLDEYLQATTIAVERDHVAVEIRLTPGVAVVRALLAKIDGDGDGLISEVEKQAYAEQVLGDLSLTIDVRRVQLRLISSTFSKVDQMKEGVGDILLKLDAEVPRGGPARRLVFENHHQSAISAYLVNCLVPTDPGVRITGQSRNYEQSVYQLDYTQTGVAAGEATSVSPTSSAESMASRVSPFEAYVYHGVRHILKGYDHLLFVSALVLAANSLWDLLKIVSAFTLAHTITLTLAALNLVHVPERVIEPLISASIIFIAIQNIFWPGRARGWSRLGAAFFFGLFHGLGFAGGLLNAMREMPGATMLVAILAFSIGVEVGHQMVVLPLFAVLKAARHARPELVTPSKISSAFQRIGSAGISLAGVYYLCAALTGRS